MTQTCTICRLPIEDGQAMTIITDATVFNDGEIDHGNTEYYHSEHVTITPR